MRFKLMVEVEVSRSSGMMCSRQAVCDALVEVVADANPSSLEVAWGDGESEFAVDDWSVAEVRVVGQPVGSPKLARIEPERLVV